MMRAEVARGLLLTASLTALLVGTAAGQTPTPTVKAAAATGRRITYQGRLTGANGQVEAARARIYKSATGNDQIWPGSPGTFERHLVNPDPDGGFLVVLGATDIDTQGDGADLDQIDPDKVAMYLELELEVDGELVLMRPRQRIYPAFHASTVDIANAVKPDGVFSGMIKDGEVTSADIRDRSIGTADIAIGAVGRGEIADGTIRSADIEDGTISTIDLTNNAVTASKIAPNSIGSSQIIDGLIFGNDLSPFAIALDCATVTSASPDEPCPEKTANCTQTVSCPSGSQLTGGGCWIRSNYRCDDIDGGQVYGASIVMSLPAATGEQWSCVVSNGGCDDSQGNGVAVQARAVCCSAKPNVPSAD